MGKENIWGTLRANGLTPEGAAALMGNLYAESTLKSNIVEKRCPMSDEEYTAGVDNGTIDFLNTVDAYGYGLAQWTFITRKTELLSYARMKGVSIGDENMQMDFLLNELRTGYAGLLSYLKTTTDMLTATKRVCAEFERPAYQNISDRYRFAQNLYNELIGGAVQVVAPPVLAKYEEKCNPAMPVLKQGDKGLAVKMAQICLVTKGYNLGVFGPNHDGVDGDFGTTMVAALQKFKAGRNLSSTLPIVDKETWEALYE